MNPTTLRCEYLRDPIGIDVTRPRLSYKLASDQPGQRQTAYRILVAPGRDALAADRGDLWDSGKVSSDRTTFIPYTGPALASAQRAWWKVRVWDAADQPSAWSDVAFWETGLLDRDRWTGKWIGSNVLGDLKTSAAAPFFRKTFTLPAGKPIARARLYATALGLYEMHLNGRRVGDDVFTPGCTDYRKRVQYQAYDVTDHLQGGDNCIAAVLGDGWYCGFMGYLGRRQFYGDRPKLLAQLTIDFADGSTQTIATDASWLTATGPILASDFQMGETCDARLDIPGWNLAAGSSDPRWQPVALFDDPGIAISASPGPAVAAVRELRPAALHVRSAALRIIDFGQNLVGRVRFTLRGAAGQTITLRFAEMLDAGGNLYTVNLRAAKQTDRYTFAGNPAGETYEPRFTFHGFRYVEIDGYTGDISADDITAVVLHSRIDETGAFECSDPLINQLQHNIQWGQRGNFIDIPTDCPQRDERLGWTGDAQVFARTAAFNFDVSGFFAKWTLDLRDAQGRLGSFPAVVPNIETVRLEGDIEHGADGGPAWADAGVIVPWTTYLCFGDEQILREHYTSMTRFVDRLASVAKNFGGIRSHPDWKGWHGFGDWLSQDVGREHVMGATLKDLIGTAYLAYDARLMTRIAEILQHPDDAKKFASIADDTVNAFRKRFVTPAGLLASHTQTAYVLALHFDLLPANLRPVAVDALVRDIRSRGNKLSTGFVGSSYLPHVLSGNGRLDVAYELLFQKDWPSWLYAVTQGATTIWERWDGWTHDKGFQDAGMNSFNHYAYGAIGAWLYQVVAGIEIDPRSPGYKHVLIHPQPGGGLTRVKASIDSVRGRISSAWQINRGTFTLDVEIPPNTTATVRLPDGGVAKEIASGRYHFACPTPTV